MSVARASDSTSSAMMSRGRWIWTTFSRMGSRDCSLMGGEGGRRVCVC